MSEVWSVPSSREGPGVAEVACNCQIRGWGRGWQGNKNELTPNTSSFSSYLKLLSAGRHPGEITNLTDRSLENSKLEKSGNKTELGKDGEQLKREAIVQIDQGPDEHLSLRNDEDIVLNSIVGPCAKRMCTG